MSHKYDYSDNLVALTYCIKFLNVWNKKYHARPSI